MAYLRAGAVLALLSAFAPGRMSAAPQVPEARTCEGFVQVSGPQAIVAPTPTYPVRALDARVSGRVVLAGTVGADGKVSDIRALGHAHPLLLAASIDALKHSQYHPAVNAGRVVPVTLQVTFSYRIARSSSQ